MINKQVMINQQVMIINQIMILMKTKVYLLSAATVLVLAASCNKQPGQTEMDASGQAVTEQVSQSGQARSPVEGGQHAAIKLTKAFPCQGNEL